MVRRGRHGPVARRDRHSRDVGGVVRPRRRRHDRQRPARAPRSLRGVPRATSSLGLDDILRGHRRGPLPLRWVYLHVLRELAQHCGHADILREQLLDR
ncbi:mycothiol transferase [Micromonospora globbae]|uniref:mycothiol transferase n=1 Tax=Micromonospora globbae TaxID=1894969 RepID=UPI0037B42CCD